MNRKKGFSLIELIVVISIIGILSSVAVTNLFNSKYSASLGTSVDILITDIKQQQLKAMVGDTEGRGIHPDAYGIHFETGSYTLFHGTNYSQSDSSNAKINLGDNIQVSSAPFLNSAIIFATQSGEILNFSTTGPYTLVIKNAPTLDQKTLIFNKFGTITSVN